MATDRRTPALLLSSVTGFRSDTYRFSHRSFLTPKPAVLNLLGLSAFSYSRTSVGNSVGFEFGFRELKLRTSRRDLRSLSSAAAAAATAAAMLPSDPFVSDLYSSGLTAAIALSLLRFWEETAKRQVFDQKLNRKLVHISIGLAFMLCWPLFSSGRHGAILASLVPGGNIIRMLLVGSGIWKDEATVKSMSRFGDHRELLKGPLYYATAITVACAIYWRTSPIAIAAICNLCAGDGIADIVGRRFGTKKLPYNRNKSIAGTVAMALAGFLASIGYMYYFGSFGYVQPSWQMASGFLFLSVASALVESLPISSDLDDNLTVTLTTVLLGCFVF